VRLVRLGDADAAFPSVDEGFPFWLTRAYAEHCVAWEGGEFHLARTDEGALVPLRLQTQPFGLRVAKVVFPPVVDGRRLEPAAEARALDALVLHLERAGFCHRLAPTPAHVAFAAHPVGAVACPWSTYAVPLHAGDEEALLAGMTRTYRRQIRNTARAGAKIETGAEQVEAVHGLVAETLRRAGAPVPAREELASLERHAGERGAVCASLWLDGALLAGIFCVFTRYGVYYLWGGSVRDEGPPGANKLLHFELMRRLGAAGALRYDFGGVWLGDPPGLASFKLHWGCRAETGFMWKRDLDPLRCRLFDRVAVARGWLRGRRVRPDRITRELELARAGATRPGAG
jgi:hypothetical protein